jgi:Carboxypeptidase regulatory-like domain
VIRVLPLLAVVVLTGSQTVYSKGDTTVAAAQSSTASAVTASAKTLEVRESNQILAPVEDVTAAYSLDPHVAEAQITENQLSIWGRAPGRAVVVLVHPDFSTSCIQITVTQAPPILPDGAWSGLSSGENLRGYYETRLSSGPLQLSNIFDYRPGPFELHFSSVVLPGRNLSGTSSVWFPYSFVRFHDDGLQLTFLDESVDSSPLSVTSTLLRGTHLEWGPIAIHAGYTSVEGFQSLLLPTDTQSIAGATFAHSLGFGSQVGVTGYFIQRNVASLDRRTAEDVGTLFFKRQLPQGFCSTPVMRCTATDLFFEIGISKGIGGALSLAHHSVADEFHLDARYRPRQYAVPETDNLNGLQSDLRWDHIWGERFMSALSGSDNRILTRPGSLSTAVATGNLQYRLFDGVLLSAGISASHFSDNNALFPNMRHFAVPVTLSYDRARFGISAQYEYSISSHAFSPGQGYRGSIRWGGPHLQLNASGGLDTQTLGIDSVYSEFPQLDALLAQLGFGAVTNVEELETLLDNRAVLDSLGIAPNATLQLVPRDWHASIDLSWRGPRETVEIDSNYNLNAFLTQNDTTVLNAVRYRRAVSTSSELVTSFTLLDSLSPVRRLDPIAEVSLRHQLDNPPFSQWKQHKGTISGTVWVRDSSGARPLSAAEITLDGTHRTTSDTQGRYIFPNVRQGTHVVQVALKSSRPFWYTTPSKVSTEADSTVDFGVIYPAAQIVGYALNDTGMGLANIGVSVKGPQGRLNLTTDQRGKFVAPVAQPGAYVVRIEVETVPDGYALEDLQPAGVSVGEGDLKKVSFAVPAIRALTGVVQRYDAHRGQYLALDGVTIELSELNRRTTSNGAGRYLFRDLPSGTFTVAVDGRPYCQVQMTAAPQTLRQDIKLRPEFLRQAMK